MKLTICFWDALVLQVANRIGGKGEEMGRGRVHRRKEWKGGREEEKEVGDKF